MKYYACNELNKGQIIISEKEIIESYFDYWKEQMIKVGKESLISHEKCIEDWIIINWAWEIEGLSHD